MPNGSDNQTPLGEQAYLQMRDLLRGGELSSGQRISEIEICERFGMSRTPVREAIRRLVTEGLLDTTEAGRIIVSQLDLSRVEEIYDMREAVEGLAARLAARRATTPDLMKLEAVIRDQEQGNKQESAFLQINDRFHNLIYQISGNRYVHSTAEALLNAASMLRGTTRGRYDYESWSLDEHRAIFHEICNGNTEGAESAMRAHVRHGRWQRIGLLMQTDISK